MLLGITCITLVISKRHVVNNAVNDIHKRERHDVDKNSFNKDFLAFCFSVRGTYGEKCRKCLFVDGKYH